MQLVDFAAPVGLLELPHPLFANYVNVERVRRSVAIIHVNYRAPAEHGHQEEEWKHNPGNFQPQVAVDGSSNFVRCFAFVAEEEINDGNRDRNGKENAHADDKQHEAVNGRSEVGGRLRIKWHLRLHGLVCSLLVQIPLRRCMFAASKNQKSNDHCGNGHDAAEAHDIENRRAVMSRGRVVLKAIEQRMIQGRSDFPCGSIDQTETNVPPGKLYTVKIAGDMAVGGEQNQATRVSKKIMFRVKIEMEIRSLRDCRDGFLR